MSELSLNVDFVFEEENETIWLKVVFRGERLALYSEGFITSIGACDACMERFTQDDLLKIKDHWECQYIPRHLAWAWKAGALSSEHSGTFGYKLVPQEKNKTYTLEVDVCPRCYFDRFKTEYYTVTHNKPHIYALHICEACDLVVYDSAEGE